ncbi:hypothetical protein C8R46DRAFT_1208060 [Mycena filopes]|nr:hypothetical protein C8R46DRAFT_1208060 [Mycena filopes]
MAENIHQIQDSWVRRRARQPRQRRPRRPPPPPSQHNEVPSFSSGQAYTFTQERSGYLVTTVQNNGSLLTTRVGAGLPLAPIRKPAPMKMSAVAQRAKALLDARPSGDELILQRLLQGPLNRKKRAAELATDGGTDGATGSKRQKKEELTPCIWLTETYLILTITTMAQPSHAQRGYHTTVPTGVSMSGGTNRTDLLPSPAVLLARRDLQRGEPYHNMEYLGYPPIALPTGLISSYDHHAQTPRRTRILLELQDLRQCAQDFKNAMPRDEAAWWRFISQYERFLVLMEMLGQDRI